MGDWYRKYIGMSLLTILSPLALFLLNFDHEWSCLTGSEKHFRNNNFLIAYSVFDVWRLLCESFCRFFSNFGSRLYPKGSLLIVLVRVSVCPCVRPPLNISETAHQFFCSLTLGMISKLIKNNSDDIFTINLTAIWLPILIPILVSLTLVFLMGNIV